MPSDFTPTAKGGASGKTLAERWILHKMTSATRDINEALADREFSKASMIVYKYWYSELCDVYIENSKAIIRDGTAEERESALQTLYTTLEAALTMIHPFMPYITEEMWQRMPRRPNDTTKSIMIAKYPTYNSELDDPESEAAYELVLDCSRGARSLMAEYSLKENASCKFRESAIPDTSNHIPVIVQAYDDKSYKTITEQLSSIQTLAGKGVAEVKINGPSDVRPSGSVAYVVGTSAAVYLHVAGRVDFDAEISKAQKKLEKAQSVISRQEKTLSDAGYKDKVSSQVQEGDEAKLADAKHEAKSYEETIKQFEQLKLE